MHIGITQSRWQLDDVKVSRKSLAFAEAYGYRENVIQILHSSPGQSVQNTYQFRTKTVQTIQPEQFKIEAANGNGLRSCDQAQMCQALAQP